MEAAYTKTNTEKFKLNQMPIILKIREVQFTKATVI